MITGEIFISTTWAASTSFVPFDIGMRDAHDVKLGGTNNRGYFATTAYVHGIWESQLYESDFLDYLRDTPELNQRSNRYSKGLEQMDGVSRIEPRGDAFRPGTVLEVSVRKLKALKAGPDRSGIQVNRRLVKGNKMVFRYLAKGELVRP